MARAVAERSGERNPEDGGSGGRDGIAGLGALTEERPVFTTPFFSFAVSGEKETRDGTRLLVLVCAAQLLLGGSAIGRVQVEKRARR